MGYEYADRAQVLDPEPPDVHIGNYRFNRELLVRQRLVQVRGQIGNQRAHRRAGARVRPGGAAIGTAGLGLDDFAGESEGVTEIDREVGG